MEILMLLIMINWKKKQKENKNIKQLIYKKKKRSGKKCFDNEDEWAQME